MTPDRRRARLLMRAAINGEWGEHTRMSFDEFC